MRDLRRTLITLFLFSLVAMSFFVALYPKALFGVSASTIKKESGSILSLVEILEEKMPKRDSEGYVGPTVHEMDVMRGLVSKIALWMQTGNTEKLEEAAQVASQIEYELVNFTDIGSKRVYLIVREKMTISRGWGTYIFYVKRLAFYKSLIIEVPHPLFDSNTPEVGILSYSWSEAGFFLLAGAHRYANRDGSSDVAWAPASIFLTVHEVLSVKDSVTIQIHGFAKTSERQNYPQIILSTGDGRTSGSVATLADFLIQHGFTVGIYDGKEYSDLQGNNQQFAYSRAVGAIFLHMEIERSIREYPESYSKVAEAVDEFGRASVIDVPESSYPKAFATAALIITISVLSFRRRSRLRYSITPKCILVNGLPCIGKLFRQP